MIQQILKGHVNSYTGKIDVENMADEVRTEIDGQRVYVVPEGHHLYDFLDDYFQEREAFERMILKRRGK
jgi:hypothetical protein